jgi:hypothetical protein
MQGVPLAPGTQPEEHGIHGATIVDAGPMAPQRVRLPWREQRLEAVPQLVRQAPITVSLLSVGTHRTGPGSQEFLPTGYHHNSLMG